MKHPSDESNQPAEAWSRADFESALPLYVGGDLEPDDLARVDDWLLAHPSDAGQLASAADAYAVMREHALESVERADTLEGLDLWPGIRAGLAESGQLMGQSMISPAPRLVAQDAQRPITPSVELGAPRGARWYEHRAFAAAAAVLLCAGITGLLVASGNGDRLPAQADGPGGAAATIESDAVGDASELVGGPAVRPSIALPSGAVGQNRLASNGVASKGTEAERRMISPLAAGAVEGLGEALAEGAPVKNANGGVPLHRPAPGAKHMIFSENLRELPLYQLPHYQLPGQVPASQRTQLTSGQ